MLSEVKSGSKALEASYLNSRLAGQGTPVSHLGPGQRAARAAAPFLLSSRLHIRKRTGSSARCWLCCATTLVVGRDPLALSGALSLMASRQALVSRLCGRQRRPGMPENVPAKGGPGPSYHGFEQQSNWCGFATCRVHTCGTGGRAYKDLCQAESQRYSKRHGGAERQGDSLNSS